MHAKLLALSIALLPMAGRTDEIKLAPTTFETRTVKIPHTTASYEFVKIPGGVIELDGRKVDVKPLWVGRTEITWDCFDIWASARDLPTDIERNRATARPEDGGTRPTRPYNPPDRGYGHENFPAISMNYEGTVDYCNWLSEKLKLKVRLPTEAEFICAAQAGAGRDPAPAELEKLAWFKTNSDKKTHPVARKAPNAWGLYDIFGNAGEWVQKPDPKDDLKFIKGGSFKDPAKDLATHARNAWSGDWQSRDPQDPKSKWWMSDGDHAGFRIVIEISNKQDNP